METITTGGTIGSVPAINSQFWLTTGPDGNVWYPSANFLGMVTPGGVATFETNVTYGTVLSTCVKPVTAGQAGTNSMCRLHI